MEMLPWILAIIAFVAGIGGRTEGNLEGYPARAKEEEEAANQFAAGRVKAQATCKPQRRRRSQRCWS
jgi:hypothetical protein